MLGAFILGYLMGVLVMAAADRYQLGRKRVPHTCNNCKDTHTYVYEGTEMVCGECPLPCPLCKGLWAYCAKTPCGCGCHEVRLPEARRQQTS